jgi:Sporulation and spore germination
MPRWLKWLVALLFLGVLVAAIYLPALRRRIKLSAKMQQQSSEQARRELTQPVPVNPGDTRVKAKMFWASGNSDGSLAESTVELPLSNDPVLRSKQVLNTLLAGPVDAELRTLPPDAALLAFYLLPNGTAVADFSEALATAIPAGIQSEQMAIDSITRTLEADVPQVQRLKILIHGQEVETLAGHLDLTGTFQVNTKSGAPSGTSALSVPSAAGANGATLPSAAPPSTAPTSAPAGSSLGNSPAATSKPGSGTDKPGIGVDKPAPPQKPNTPTSTPTTPSNPGR